MWQRKSQALVGIFDVGNSGPRELILMAECD